MTESSRVLLASLEHHSLYLPYGMKSSKVGKVCKAYKEYSLPKIKNHLHDFLEESVSNDGLVVKHLNVFYQLRPTFRKTPGIRPQQTCQFINVDTVITVTVEHDVMNLLKLKNNTVYGLVKDNGDGLRNLLYFESKAHAFTNSNDIDQFCPL